MFCNGREMFVTLRDCRLICNGCDSWWNNDRRFWVTLGNNAIHNLAIIRAICRHRRHVSIDLIKEFDTSVMSPTSSGVNSTATISCVSASTPRCSLRHRRRDRMPCF